MDKVLVEVFVPAAGQTFDVLLPRESKLFEIVLLLAGTMTELSEGQFTGTDHTVLCERRSGDILNINLTVGEQGLLNGTKLMLV